MSDRGSEAGTVKVKYFCETTTKTDHIAEGGRRNTGRVIKSIGVFHVMARAIAKLVEKS